MKKHTDQQLPRIYLSTPGELCAPTGQFSRHCDKAVLMMSETRGRTTTIQDKTPCTPFPDSPIHSDKRLNQDISLSPVTDGRQDDSKIVEWSHSVDRVISGEFDSPDNSEQDPEGCLLNISVSLTETPGKRVAHQQTPDGLFLNREVLHPVFYRLCHDFLLERYYTKKMYEPWSLGDLYQKFSALSIANPFCEPALATKVNPQETVCSLFERWIFSYEQEPGLILSFDFVLNHPSMILCLLFYWVQSGWPLLPFCSDAQARQVEKNCNRIRQNILLILDDEREHRPREITRNFILFKLISEFYRWVMEEPMFALPESHLNHVRASWKAIHQVWLVGQDIKKTMAIDSKHDIEMLEKISNNYENKDKLIADRMSDVADLFDEVDRNTIMMTPLSDYFQTGLGENSMKKAANRYTQLSCWLLAFVVRKAKTSLDLSVAYINRYVELFQEFRRRENYQSAVLFAGVLVSIKSFMPNIWAEMIERSPKVNLDRQIDQLVDEVQVAGFESRSDRPCLFSNTTAYRLLESIRAQSHKQYLQLGFHRSVQKLARKIVQCRSLLQKFYYERRSSSIRLNLNQRFLSSYIYEVFRRDNQLCQAQQYHEELKREARKLDKNYDDL